MMRTKIREESKAYLFYIVAVMAGIAALLPLSCGYLMGGGIIGEWIARVKEVALGFGEGRLYLFPSAEVFAECGGYQNPMDSSFWLLLPGAIYKFTGKMELAYGVYMFLVQVGTLAFALFMFCGLFPHRDRKMPACFGVLLYMTCPYRIYVSYELGDFSQTAAWMVLPLYVWAVTGILEENGRRKRYVLVAALALAGIGYGDVVYFLVAAGITLLAGICKKRLWAWLPVVLGSLLFLPGLYRLARYLFLDEFGELNLPLKSIMPEGIRPGQFFASYAFRDGHPGMGIGIFVCMLAGIWLIFVERKTFCKKCRAFMSIALLGAVLSLEVFPWDLFQRLGFWALKLVSLIGTPVVFWGIASACLCIPAAYAMEQTGRHEDKRIAFAVPVIVLLACLGLCIYQCNMLTYTRFPLD